MTERWTLRRVVALVMLLGSALWPAMAAAQNWPDRPVKMLVPAAAGGTADILTRLVSARLSDALGQQLVIENRPGAGGHIAGAAAAHADADGYTLFSSGFLTHSVGTLLFKNLTYDPMKDLPPFAMMAISPNMLVVRASLPVKSLQEFIALAKSKPGGLTYSSSGIGTSGHLAGELLKKMAGIDVVHVPFKSGPDSVTAVLAGDIDFTFFTLPALLPQVEDGKLRAIAITSKERSALVPNVPTVAELGFPDFEVIAWYGLSAPRGTPPAITARLTAETKRIVESEEMKAKFATLGSEPRFLDAKGTADFVAKDTQRWSGIIASVKP